MIISVLDNEGWDIIVVFTMHVDELYESESARQSRDAQGGMAKFRSYVLVVY
jgi:hypothetical protein